MPHLTISPKAQVTGKLFSAPPPREEEKLDEGDIDIDAFADLLALNYEDGAKAAAAATIKGSKAFLLLPDNLPRQLTGTYTHRDKVISGMKKIMAYLGRADVSKSVKHLIVDKIIEGVTECTPGFHDRINTICSSLKQPENIESLLELQRVAIVDRVARQLRFTTRTKDGYLYEVRGDDVHRYNDVFTAASTLGYGVIPPNPDDVYKMNLVSSCDSLLQRAFSKQYHPVAILASLQSQLESSLREIVFARVGDSTDPTKDKLYQGEMVQKKNEYPIGAIDTMVSYLNKMLGKEYTVDELMLSVYDSDNFCSHYIDVNWSFVQARLVEKMRTEGYFSLSPDVHDLLTRLNSTDVRVYRRRIALIRDKAAEDIDKLDASSDSEAIAAIQKSADEQVAVIEQSIRDDSAALTKLFSYPATIALLDEIQLFEHPELIRSHSSRIIFAHAMAKNAANLSLAQFRKFESFLERIDSDKGSLESEFEDARLEHPAEVVKHCKAEILISLSDKFSKIKHDKTALAEFVHTTNIEYCLAVLEREFTLSTETEFIIPILTFSDDDKRKAISAQIGKSITERYIDATPTPELLEEFKQSVKKTILKHGSSSDVLGLYLPLISRIDASFSVDIIKELEISKDSRNFNIAIIDFVEYDGSAYGLLNIFKTLPKIVQKELLRDYYNKCPTGEEYSRSQISRFLKLADEEVLCDLCMERPHWESGEQFSKIISSLLPSDKRKNVLERFFNALVEKHRSEGSLISSSDFNNLFNKLTTSERDSCIEQCKDLIATDQMDLSNIGYLPKEVRDEFFTKLANNTAYLNCNSFSLQRFFSSLTQTERAVALPYAMAELRTNQATLFDVLTMDERVKYIDFFSAKLPDFSGIKVASFLSFCSKEQQINSAKEWEKRRYFEPFYMSQEGYVLDYLPMAPYISAKNAQILFAAAEKYLTDPKNRAFLNGASISLLMNNLLPKQRTTLIGIIKDDLQERITFTPEEFLKVLSLLGDEDRALIFNAQKEKISDMLPHLARYIQSHEQLNTILPYLDKSQKEVLIGQLREKLPSFIKTGHDFLATVKHVDKEESKNLYNVIKNTDEIDWRLGWSDFAKVTVLLMPEYHNDFFDKFETLSLPLVTKSTLINELMGQAKSAAEITIVSQYAKALLDGQVKSDTQVAQVLNKLNDGNKLLLLEQEFFREIIKRCNLTHADGTDKKLASNIKFLESLTPESRAVVFDLIKDNVTAKIATCSEFKQLSSLLNQAQRIELYHSTRSKLLDLVVTKEDLKNVIENLPSATRVDFYTEIHARKPELLSTALATKGLGDLPAEEQNTLCALLRPRLASIIEAISRAKISPKDTVLDEYCSRLTSRITTTTDPVALIAIEKELNKTLESVTSAVVTSFKDKIQDYRRTANVFNNQSVKADTIEAALCAIAPQDRMNVMKEAINPVQRALATHRITRTTYLTKDGAIDTAKATSTFQDFKRRFGEAATDDSSKATPPTTRGS